MKNNLILLNILTKNAEINQDSISYLNNLHKQINNLTPNLMNLISIYKVKPPTSLNIIYKNYLKFSKINSLMPFKSFIHNYYKISSVEKVSKIMNKCTDAFNKKKSNFLK